MINMLVLQQIKVLPKGAEIIIYDGFDIVLDFKKSNVDGTPLFDDIRDADKYDKVYSTFKVHCLNGYIYNPSPQKERVIYQIQIREGYEI